MPNDATIIGDKPVAKSHAGEMVSQGEATKDRLLARNLSDNAKLLLEGAVVARDVSPSTTVASFPHKHQQKSRSTNRKKRISKESKNDVIDFRQFAPVAQELASTEILQEEMMDLSEAYEDLSEARKEYVEIRNKILARMLNGAPVQRGNLNLKLGVHLELDGRKLL